MLDDGLDNLELNISPKDGFRDSNILEEQVLHLLTIINEKIYIIPIINNQVRSKTLTTTLRIYQGMQDAFTVLLETHTLQGKYSSIFIIRNDSHSVVLGRENVTKAPTEVTAEDLDSINQHCHLDGHVEKSRNMGQPGISNIYYVDLLARIVSKVNVSVCTSW